MSVIRKSTEEFLALSKDEQMQYAKDRIIEYHETHTKEDYAQFVDLLEARWGGAK